MAEIGLIGTAYGRYNLHLGGDRLGLRLNRRYAKDLDEAGILAVLDGLFADYVRDRAEKETFGDYMNRRGWA